MPPTLEPTPDGATAVLVHHKGSLLQAFLAPWTHPGKTAPTMSLHLQDLAGGVGQIVEVGSPLHEELKLFHPEVAQLQPAPQAVAQVAAAAPAAAIAQAPAIDYQALAAAIVAQQAAAAPPAPPES